jgi:hypothetical protein
MRRVAWKACNSWSADSDSKCPDSLAQLGAQWVDPLPGRVQYPGDRILRQPVDLEVRHEPPQLACDSDIPPGVTEPDRRRDVQRAPGAVASARPRGRRSLPAAEERSELEVRANGVAALRAVP